MSDAALLILFIAFVAAAAEYVRAACRRQLRFSVRQAHDQASAMSLVAVGQPAVVVGQSTVAGRPAVEAAQL